VRSALGARDFAGAQVLASRPACPPALRAEVRQAEATDCDRRVEAELAAGRPREARAQVSAACSKAVADRALAASSASAADDLARCRETVERLHAERKWEEAARFVQGRTCARDTFEKATRERDAHDCEARLSRIQAARPEDLDLGALLAFDAPSCAASRARAEEKIASDRKALLAKSPCLLLDKIAHLRPERARAEALAPDGVGAACFARAKADARAGHHSEVAAAMRLLDTMKLPGLAPVDALADLADALSARPPAASVQGLPTPRAIRLAREAVAERSSRPWFASLARALAYRDGFPWSLPEATVPFPHWLRDAGPGVLVVVEGEARSAGPRQIAVRASFRTTTVREAATRVPGGTYTTMEPGRGGVGLEAVQHQAPDRTVGGGTTSTTVLDRLTFVGAGAPDVVVTSDHPVLGPKDEPLEIARGSATRAWPDARAQMVARLAEAAIARMRAASTDAARLEAAAEALALGATSPEARALAEKHLGPLPAGPLP
jgi:hypothetical protein